MFLGSEPFQRSRNQLPNIETAGFRRLCLLSWPVPDLSELVRRAQSNASSTTQIIGCYWLFLSSHVIDPRTCYMYRAI